MKRLRVILPLIGLLLFTGQALAKDERNLTVNQLNGPVSGKRVALVIGNSAYTSSPLKNPINDASDVAAKLRTLGFEVIERNDLTIRQIGRTLSEFRSKLVPGGVALVFYAGHGLQIKGENYLPAVDADISAEEDVPTQSISVRYIMELLDEAKTRLNLVFLDACRNNPYARSFRSATGDGLARISAPSGTLISYATRPGSVAADGDGRNGLYTSKLLAHMDSNLQIELTLKRVVSEVKGASQGRQEPWMEGSIEGDFCFAGCTPPPGTQTASLQPSPVPTQEMHQPAAVRVKSKEEIEQETWESARDSANVAVIQEYIKQYPKGMYVGQARVLLATLKPAAGGTAAPVAYEDAETALWREAQKNGGEDELNAYLTQYPKGKFSSLAKLRIKKIAEENVRKEQGEWDDAIRLGSEEAFQSYVRKWPGGQFADAAQTHLNTIRAERKAREEQVYWQEAESDEKGASLQAYMDKYPDGKYVAVAKEKLAVIKENKLWQEAQADESGNTLKSYLDQYPSGKYAAAARQKLAILQEQAVWNKVQELQQSDEKGAAMQAYLDQYPNGRYAAAALDAIGKMVNVGGFVSHSSNLKELECWGFGKIKLPDSEPFSESVRRSFIEELKKAKLYYSKAPVTLTGSLEEVRFTLGEWRLELEVKSPNGKKLTMPEEYAFDTKSSGKAVCEQTLRAFTPAVQSMVAKIVSSPEFPALYVKSGLKKSDEASLKKVAASRAEEESAREQLAWDNASKEASEKGYRRYLELYPQGRYAAAAKKQVDKLKGESDAKQEQSAWEKAEQESSEKGYQRYLSSFPQGANAKVAQARIAKLKSDSDRKAEKLREEAAKQAAEKAEAESDQAAANMPKPGTILKDCAECPEMVVIPAGNLDAAGNEGDPDNKVFRRNLFNAAPKLMKSFAMGKTEVTQGEWRALMGTDPSGFNECGDDCPVDSVSWDDVQSYIRKLNAKTGKQYRLPNETEWEYACRAGGTYAYCGSNNLDSVAWYDGNSDKTTNPVARKLPNAFGLYDMTGNVWEWVEDARPDAANLVAEDAEHMLRGGGWYLKAQAVGVTARNRHKASYRGSGSGFRLLRVLP